MKKLLIIVSALILTASLCAQPAKKSTSTEKAPTQKEMQDMMKEAQKQLQNLDPETKRMMDSLGIKMPDMKTLSSKVANVTDAQLAKAWEDENRIVPLKDANRIALANQQIVTEASLAAFIQKLNAAVFARFSQKELNDCEQALQWISKKLQGNALGISNAAVQLWMLGKYKAAIYVLGKQFSKSNDANTLNNYAAFLTIAGAEEWALPALNYLDKKYPQNSSILNNLSQAWYSLGDMDKADDYAKKALLLCVFHPQANMVRSKIAESKGNTTEAISFAKKAMEKYYSPEKEAQLSKLGYKLKTSDYNMPVASKKDLLNLGGLQAPPFPQSVDDCLLGTWKIFRSELQKEIAALTALKDEAVVNAQKAQNARVQHATQILKASYTNGISNIDPRLAPRYAAISGKKQMELSDLWLKKVLSLAEKKAAFENGEGARLRQAYDNDMKDLKKRDNDQTGEGKPNVDFCPQYKKRSDEFLKAYNTPLEFMYKEYLQLTKDYANQLSSLQLYGSWPEQYEAEKLSDKLLWLKALSNEEFPFKDITTYNCQPSQGNNKKNKLGEFKDPKCQDTFTVRLGLGSISTTCYETISKLDIDLFNIEIFSAEMRQNDKNIRDAKNTFDYIRQSFMNATIEFGPSEEIAMGTGPFKLEAEGSLKVVAEFSKDKGLSDIGVKAGVEVKATASEIKTVNGKTEDVGVKTDITLVGLETKVTVNSGFTVEGKGILAPFNKK